MKEKQPPQGIDDLLRASPQDLKQWGKEIQLASPEELAAETRMAQAWLQQEHPAQEHPAQEQQVSLWERIIAGLKQQRFWLVPVVSSAFIVLFVIWGRTPHVTTPRSLVAKGKHTRPTDVTVSLHLGTKTRSSASVRRIQQGESLSREQSLFLAFTLQHPGYLTLWYQEQKASPKLLYRDSSKIPKPWRRGFSNFSIGGVTQEYSLQSHRGTLHLAVVWSQKPLLESEMNKIKQSPNLLSVLKQMSSSSQSKSLAFDSYTLQIK